MAPILAELEAVPEWGVYAERKERDGTAHGDMTDLWMRGSFDSPRSRAADYNALGKCVFYPVWDKLPSLHPVVWTLMASQKSVELGGMSATRLPPGGRIERHSDAERGTPSATTEMLHRAGGQCRCVVECDGDEQVFRELASLGRSTITVPHSMRTAATTQRTATIVCLRVRTMKRAPKPARDDQPLLYTRGFTEDVYGAGR